MSEVKRQYEDMSDDELRSLAAKNSEAWHSADGAGQTRLHDENVVINRVLDQRRGETTAFDPDSGTWGPRQDTAAPPKAGMGFQPTKAVSASGDGPAPAGSFTYQSAPAYVEKYQGLVDKLTKELLDRKPFEYDPESDPMYQQYKQSYTRNGKRAMEDTLGQVSARTGGLASSYAGSAAQQTYDGYMAQLADKAPQLRQLAYQMYLDEENAKRADLDMLRGLGQDEYSKYLTQLGQYNADRSFDYGLHRDRVGDEQWQQSFDFQQDQEAYGREQDALKNQQWEKQFDYGVEQDELARGDQDKQSAMNRIYAYLQAGGQVEALPPELVAQSGLSAQELETLAADYAMQRDQSSQKFAAELAATQAATAAKYASANDGTGSKPKLTAAQTLKALKDGAVNEETLAAYRYWYGEDWEDEEEEEEEEEEEDTPGGAAVPVPTGQPLDWENRDSYTSRPGSVTMDLTGYAAELLNDYAAGAMSNEELAARIKEEYKEDGSGRLQLNEVNEIFRRLGL